ncbi:hypothetical protein [uncultured Flavobacterium sp.]|uniref:hypothetical protein n=1 Tax=uncultured Flavobacterium sp. TaxID=165435 RepID=UPI0030ED5B69|tara:strand:+ start:11743 stop:12183 length:441 start_codon:yes stop_codon:yes gene_type:complete
MFYNAEKPIDVQRAIVKFQHLIEKKKTFELTQKKEKRTLNQNSYLHLILSFFALEYGETLEYVKFEFFKKLVNKQIFEYERINVKTGEIRIDYRSSASLNTKEMTDAIERFRNYSSKEAGIYLPTPEEGIMLKEIELQIKNNEQWI